MPKEPIFAWYGEQYASEERGSDWYWALGIITLALCVVSVLFGEILLTLLIVAAAAAVALQASKHQRTHHFAIYDNGIAVDDNLYLFKDMRDFAILEYFDEALPPALSVKTNHIFAPHLLIPINEYEPEQIYEYVSLHLPEGMHEETLLDRLTAVLRF